MNEHLESENNNGSEYFIEGLSSFRIVTNSESKLEFKRASIIRLQQLPLAIISSSVVLLSVGYKYGWLYCLLLVLVIVTYVSFYWSSKPVNIIAEKDNLTLVFKRLFIIPLKISIPLKNIIAVRPNYYTKSSWSSNLHYAKVEVSLKSGEVYTLYEGIRSTINIAEKDSRLLSKTISEKIGVLS